uniref:Vicilin n=1 Tax=Matteuccia struthiopteris TaxID=3277 RepID=Q40371_MATST|nr:vicilin [Matteuccia struthiopteris]
MGTYTLRYKSCWWVVAALLLCIGCRTSLSTRWPQYPHDHALPSIPALIGQMVAEPLHVLDKQLQLKPLFSEDGQAVSGYDGGRQEEEHEREREHEHERHQKEEEEHEHHHHHEKTQRQESFVLEKPIKVIKTEAGELRMLPQAGINSELVRQRLGLGFLSLEPKALLIPQYIDADCLFLVHEGRGQLSWVEEGDVQEVDVEEGDVFEIESGTVFYMLNQDEGQRLSIFSIYDTATVFNDQMFHSFFVAGGQKPKTILSGFDEDVLATVFKAHADEVGDMLSSQTQGPIIYFSGRNESKRGDAAGLGLGKSLTDMLDRYIGLPTDSGKKPYNLFKEKADFGNDYGSTTTIHGKDFKLLKALNKGVFLVRLKAGAVLAPHWNPRATEIALVTKGEGETQIVYPNGSAAATQRVSEGSVFFVPQNFPMCQIASQSGSFEFMGFTTSSRPNRPQFLAGSNSVLKGIEAEVLASSFNIPVEHLQHFLHLQPEAVILPGQPTKPNLDTII